MFGLQTLDVLIGLVTVYLVFGIACTAIVEAVASWLSMRSRNLEDALKEFLSGDLKAGTTFVDAFYAHPLVQVLSKGKDGRPSYIPPAVVGQVVAALVTAQGTAAALAPAIDTLPGTVESNRIKGLLDTLVKQTVGDPAAFRKAVETHFDETMDRAAGWFKRRAQTITLIVSALLVIAANADTVELAQALASSPTARVKLVEVAQQNLKDAQGTPTQASAAQALTTAESVLESGSLPFGWKGFTARPGINDVLAKIAGLVVSIFAVSLGAPFWFDVLQRFMQVRAAGVSPREPKAGKGA
jgi:hypothetical protein